VPTSEVREVLEKPYPKAKKIRAHSRSCSLKKKRRARAHKETNSPTTSVDFLLKHRSDNHPPKKGVRKEIPKNVL
jgi:hypothetical protein